MVFVGGGGNICHHNCPTLIIVCVLYCKHQIVYGIYLSYFLCVPEALVFRWGDKPWPAASCSCCSNVPGRPGTLVTWPWLRLSMIYCFALRFWSQIGVTCLSCWFPVSVALPCCVGARCLGPVGWRHTYEIVTEHFANPNLSVVIAKCWFLRFVVWNRTFMC